ncbi:hypothetical protein BGAPBR_I0057 (plasmid) [Borreliella garinii PBr]|uniref:Uncharacterized protein n=1 Tax=Borreliella garinii PBr TaxID=498743 RepID=B8F136_BORGR|nr:hypothetical protein BGAPBR_I0057 [Borreliella garinii PBr]
MLLIFGNLFSILLNLLFSLIILNFSSNNSHPIKLYYLVNNISGFLFNFLSIFSI